MEHSERILQIMEARGVTAYRIAKDAVVSESVFSEWRRKPSSNIYSSNLVRIANYLECSVDYLLGQTENPEVNR